MLAEFFRIERLCRSVGLSERHTDELLQGKVLVVTGKLHSDEYRRSFAVEKARLQVGREERGWQDRTRPARGQSADCPLV